MGIVFSCRAMIPPKPRLTFEWTFWRSWQSSRDAYCFLDAPRCWSFVNPVTASGWNHYILLTALFRSMALDNPSLAQFKLATLRRALWSAYSDRPRRVGQRHEITNLRTYLVSCLRSPKWPALASSIKLYISAVLNNHRENLILKTKCVRAACLRWLGSGQ